MLEGLKRHAEITGEALKLDRQRARSAQKRDETDFLPANLEILETPPRPLGRIVLWLLIAFILIAVAWAFLGRIDIVAIAEGRVTPLGRVKIIQSLEQGVVRAIYVREGQAVAAGAPLIELDPTVSGAEVEQARQALLVAQTDRARATALLDFANGKPGKFVGPEGIDPVLLATQEAIVSARIREHAAVRAGLVQERTQAASSVRMVEADLERLRQQLPLVEERLTGLQRLSEKGLAPRMRVAEVEERAVGLRADIVVRGEEIGRSNAALSGADQKLAQLDGTFRREALDAFNEADAAVRLRQEELTIKLERADQTTLTAPEAGVIQQLQVNTIGGVVKAAEPLMILVPRGGALVVEAQVLNRDAGFVREGQPVEIKLEAYPFTRYGVVPGVIENISRDAVTDEKKGLVYNARVRLTRPYIVVDGKRLLLTPGLAAQAEIRTGRRRVIELLLSPLAKRVDEAGRER